DSFWSNSLALFYIEDAALPAPKNTPLPGTPGALPNTAYFRTHFAFNNPTPPNRVVNVNLQANTIIDDGAAFYLNGAEVFRLGLPDPPAVISFGTAANRSIGDAALEGPFAFPTGGLADGDNVMAVEVHQINATSSDVVFGMSLDALVTVRNPDIQAPTI